VESQKKYSTDDPLSFFYNQIFIEKLFTLLLTELMFCLCCIYIRRLVHLQQRYFRG